MPARQDAALEGIFRRPEAFSFQDKAVLATIVSEKSRDFLGSAVWHGDSHILA